MQLFDIWILKRNVGDLFVAEHVFDVQGRLFGRTTSFLRSFIFRLTLSDGFGRRCLSKTLGGGSSWTPEPVVNVRPISVGSPVCITVAVDLKFSAVPAVFSREARGGYDVFENTTSYIEMRDGWILIELWEIWYGAFTSWLRFSIGAL